MAIAPPRSMQALATGKLALLAWLVTLLLAGMAWLLGMLNGLDLERFFGEFIVGPVVAAVAFGAVGSLIVGRQPRNRIGWLLCAIGILDAGTSFVSEYARYGLVTNPGGLPAATFAAWVNLWFWIPQLMLATTFVPLLFPDGRLPSRRWRAVAWAAAGVMAVETIAASVTSHADASLPEVANPYAIVGADIPLRFIEQIGIPVQAALALLAVLSLVDRYRHAPVEQRQAIKWLGYASTLVTLILAAPAALFLIGLDPALLTVLSGVLQTIAVLWLAVAIGIGVLRYRLWDIDVLINRTLAYAILSACVIGVYVAIVGYLGAAFHARGDVASLLAAAVVAIAFQPLHLRTRRAVNRLLYGRRDEPYAVLADLSHRLAQALTAETVLPTIVETVRDALKVPYVAISLWTEAQIELAASSGSAVQTDVRLPLVYQHERIGELALSRRTPTEDFAPADRRLLEDIARQAGVAAHAVRLTAELQRSRERLVSAREEERRRLRRDLHDGLGPVLAALTLQLDTVRFLLRQDPSGADSLVVELKSRMQAAVADVRRLVYGLRPPALDDLGLAGALRAAAAQYDHRPGGPQLEIDLPSALCGLPAAVEVAIYLIAQEALTNVVRHARAQRCTLRVLFDAAHDVLILEVTDDGRGLADDRTAGVGLQSMRERAAEVGGRCTIEALSSGGTRVYAELPCKSPSAS